MKTGYKSAVNFPPEQRVIHERCIHPSGSFVEFNVEEVNRPISQRFEEQVRLYSERLAVKSNSEQLTYAELNRTSNRIAHVILSRRGEEPEPIALLLEHGVAALAAVMGTLKAGKFYVALDPTAPRSRTIEVLEETRPTLILTNDLNLPMAQGLATSGTGVANLSSLNADLAEHNPGVVQSADALASLIFTTGSTGKPKGAIHTHQSLLHMIRNHTNIYHICGEDRCSLLYPPTVIGGVRDMLGALLNGASLFPYDIKVRGMTEINEWLRKEEITTLRCSATVFRNFLQGQNGQATFPHIRFVCLGNETIHRGDFELYRKYFEPGCIFGCGLGTSEVSLVRQFFADTQSVILEDPMPSGYPVPGVDIDVIDEDCQPLDANQLGEIVIKSPYLSLGYWNRPDLTAAKFLSDPDNNNQRQYLTGDLGVIRPDGCLIHLGRKDFQVKIKGYNVAPPYVESVLLSLDIVNKATVTVKENQQGERRLVAYVVPDGNGAANVSELRRLLSSTLPDYMIPSTFVLLDSLPLAPNGKVDLQALPEPGHGRPDLETPFVGPRTPLEEALTGIWTQVLGIDQLGINDDFLDLGGDSLLASQVIARVIRTFQVEVPLRSLIDTCTIADMALAIVQNQANEARDEDINRMLAELEALSDEEAQRYLRYENQSSMVSDK